MKIKKFKQFNESVDSQNVIILSKEESELFTTEAPLQKLISTKKVKLMTPELEYSQDPQTIKTLKSYFPEIG